MMLLRTADGPAAQTGAAPTFNRDVAPILFANCVSCHRPGEVAPMSLLSYADARPWAAAIKQKVLLREMPPWFADPRYGRFRNARVLTDAQIDTLAAWADGGAPEGDGPAAAAPLMPPGSAGFMDRPPDYVLQMPVPLEIPSAGEAPYIKLWSRTPFRRDMYLEAVELRPSNRRVTHHSSAGMMAMPPGARLTTARAWPGGPMVRDAVALLRDGRPAADGTTTGNVMVFYVPGGGFQRFPPGMARRMRPNELVLWSIHYMPTGRPETDRHSLALWVAKTPPTHEVVTAAASEVHLVEGEEVLAGDDRLLAPIPPHAANYERTGIIAFREPVTLVALWSHMHNHGKDMTFIVVYPDGREETILHVPRYDFNWQIQYMLAEPLKLPAGSAIRATAHYDNSRANPRNTAPDRPVEWGLQSWNEMFGPFLEIAYDNRPLPPTRRPDLFGPECDPSGGAVDPVTGERTGGGLFGRGCP
jgi:hypothetical protein